MKLGPANGHQFQNQQLSPVYTLCENKASGYAFPFQLWMQENSLCTKHSQEVWFSLYKKEKKNLTYTLPNSNGSIASWMWLSVDRPKRTALEMTDGFLATAHSTGVWMVLRCVVELSLPSARHSLFSKVFNIYWLTGMRVITDKRVW